jgi:hypothetical protein
MRHARAGSANAGDAREHADDVSQRVVLAAEDVLFSHAPARGGKQMPVSYVSHVDRVEAGVDGREQTPAM